MYLKNSLLSSFSKERVRGASMTEYAILLAFVAAVAVFAFTFEYEFEWGTNSAGEEIFVGKNLASSIYASVLNMFSALSKALNR